NTTIYVTITSYNFFFNAAACSEIYSISLKIAITISCTALSSPINGANNVSVSTNLQWNAASGATGYRLSVGTSSGATDIVNNTDVGNVTSYSFASNLPENTTIYVTITPYNSVGDATGCSVEVFNTELLYVNDTKYGFSPNGDGINDVWVITTIEQYPNNTVTIYNRWGDIVFQAKGYNNTTIVFDGRANKNTNMGAGELPEGTYFFSIDIQGTHPIQKTKGFLVLKR
ncbi:MAG: gliding motility-associated C-terminal domain-containing protein, partial [Flavobacteriaceae bacterium]|nr:gliding motility-associated C-terminal domain-containing protein [Flavobacteriaceae bacterium]